ncbi:MAG: ABC transporter permease subunit [Clostridia bacterium]|nr:ABC transporter permease subunit [Clostridia bacterium]
MLAIYKREMRSFFTSVIGYVFLVLYLAVGGAVFCFTTLYAMSADVTSFYLYMMIFSGLILPILTMKSFSEERKIRTEALLLTAPVPLWSMVLGKFFAVMTVFSGAILVNSLYFIFLTPYAFVKLAILLGNLLAVLLVGMVFISIGLFVSSLTENQLAAAIGTIAIILVFLCIGLVNSLLPSGYWLRYIFDCISIFSRFQSYTNGYFDFASLLYYLSVCAAFLYFTVRVYERRRYHG